MGIIKNLKRAFRSLDSLAKESPIIRDAVATGMSVAADGHVHRSRKIDDASGKFFVIGYTANTKDLSTPREWKLVTKAGEAILAEHVQYVEYNGFMGRKGFMRFSSRECRVHFNTWYEAYQEYVEYANANSETTAVMKD